MDQEVNVCPNFWKDIKRTRSQSLKVADPNELFSSLDDLKKIESIPVVQNIVSLILNSLDSNILDGQSDKYFKQPFLHDGWVIRKLRWAIDNRGKRNGLRVIFAINECEILMILIATKNDCDDEKKLEKEIMLRIRNYLCI